MFFRAYGDPWTGGGAVFCGGMVGVAETAAGSHRSTHGRHRDVTQNPPRVMRHIFPTTTHGATLLIFSFLRKQEWLKDR